MPIYEFPQSVIEALGYYVYLLRDPESSEVFYVGKGVGNRVFHHAAAALDDAQETDKLSRIRAIQAKDLPVQHEIVRHGLTEKEAFEVEAALIDLIGIDGLTNLVHGMHSDDRGRMTVADIIEKYAAPDIQITEPVLLIIVNRFYHKGMSAEALYEVTRGNWKIGVRREKARYAFALYRGIVRAVYRIDRWYPATEMPEGFNPVNRWRFDGEIATDLLHYIGGSVGAHHGISNTQNPIRYVNC